MNTDTGRVRRIVDDMEGRLSLDVAQRSLGRWFRRLLIFGVIATVVTVGFTIYGDYYSWKAVMIIEHRQESNHFLMQHLDRDIDALRTGAHLTRAQRMALRKLDLTDP